MQVNIARIFLLYCLVKCCQLQLQCWSGLKLIKRIQKSRDLSVNTYKMTDKRNLCERVQNKVVHEQVDEIKKRLQKKDTENQKLVHNSINITNDKLQSVSEEHELKETLKNIEQEMLSLKKKTRCDKESSKSKDEEISRLNIALNTKEDLKNQGQKGKDMSQIVEECWQNELQKIEIKRLKNVLIESDSILKEKEKEVNRLSCIIQREKEVWKEYGKFEFTFDPFVEEHYDLHNCLIAVKHMPTIKNLNLLIKSVKNIYSEKDEEIKYKNNIICKLEKRINNNETRIEHSKCKLDIFKTDKSECLNLKDDEVKTSQIELSHETQAKEDLQITKKIENNGKENISLNICKNEEIMETPPTRPPRNKSRLISSSMQVQAEFSSKKCKTEYYGDNVAFTDVFSNAYEISDEDDVLIEFIEGDEESDDREPRRSDIDFESV